jgi:hypothetical protein
MEYHVVAPMSTFRKFGRKFDKIVMILGEEQG